MQCSRVFVFLTFALPTLAGNKSCEVFPGDAGKIRLQKIRINFNVTLSNDANELNASLRLVYQWKLFVPDGLRYDGLLYKHIDHEGNDMRAGVSPPRQTTNSGDYTCDRESGKSLWALTQNGTSVECEMPCSTYFPLSCGSMGVCFRRNEDGYQPLPKGTERLEFDVRFGRLYEMMLLVYRQWDVLKEFHQITSMAPFCAEELITNHSISEKTAAEYCNKTQRISESEYATGPPSHLERYSVTINLSNNKANVVFRFKDPHDLAHSVALIKGYAIHTDGGIEETIFVTKKNRCIGSYYCVKIRDVEFQKINKVSITPYVLLSTPNCQDGCRGQGYTVMKSYIISEMDACNITLGYCDIHANCTDLPGINRTAAICSCSVGYVGNGINVSLPGGTGCKDIDPCSLQSADTCATDADCIDLPPPSMGTSCSCKPNYFGDGFKDGSGCTKLSTVVLLSTVVPLILAVVIITFLFIRRIKIAKMGSKRFSKFLVSDDVKYSAPISTSVSNGDTLSGAFGAKYEIERDRIQFTGILDRGNFGVVHKATMKMNDGCKVVAVKTTAAPHSAEMEKEFLAEIGLITTLGNHENIVGIIGCCTTVDSIIYLVTQFMKYGDLQHFLWDAREEKNRKEDPAYNLTEKSIYDIGEQVASGLEHLTGLRIIHGDIAARNVLVDEGLKCKISDFGLANDVYRYGAIKGAREKRVPIKWISPERMQQGAVPITWRSDVWSYGILLFESITIGAAPFSEVLQEELLPVLRSGYRMPKPACCSGFLYGVMMKCWEWTPSKRPSFKELKWMMKKAMSKQPQPDYANLSEAFGA